MTEYECSAAINGTQYDFLTLGAVTQSHAQSQFAKYLLEEEAAVLDLAEVVLYRRVDTGSMH